MLISSVSRSEFLDFKFKFNSFRSETCFFNITISASNAQKVNTTGTFNTLTVDAGAIVSISNNLTDLADKINLNNVVRFFPNPSNQKIILESNLSGTIQFDLFDITGREILKGEFVNSKTLDLSKFESGTYVLRFESGQTQINKKLLIEH